MASHARTTPIALAAMALLAASLGACKSSRPDTTSSVYPHDVRERHSYVLTDGTRTLDIFPAGIGHLDPRQAADLEAFLLEYRRYGRGTIVLDIPQGASPALATSTERTVGAIRSFAGGKGIRTGFSVAYYRVTDPTLAAPVRISFQSMEAKVAGKCGMWPQDLGATSAASSVRNEPYWNLGCATRSNFAAQVADPVDLVRGRPEGRIDTVRRTQVIDKLRQGNDPSTTWKQDGGNKVKDEAKAD